MGEQFDASRPIYALSLIHIFYDVFDTVTQVIAYCESEEEFNTQMDALHADLITCLLYTSRCV